MSLDKVEGHDVTKLDELDVDLIICGIRTADGFNGHKDKKQIQAKNLDPYNNLEPKAGVKFDATANEKPKEENLRFDDFKKLNDMTKLVEQSQIDQMVKNL